MIITQQEAENLYKNIENIENIDISNIKVPSISLLGIINQVENYNKMIKMCADFKESFEASSDGLRKDSIKKLNLRR